MKSPRRHTALCLTLAALAAAITGGCRLDRSIIPPGWATAQPSRYCPGDTVTASYDFLGAETCRDEATCAGFHPTVTLTSDPMDFPPRAVTGYADRFDFMPSGERVRLHFTPDRNAVRVPTSRTDEEGRPIDVLREGVNPESVLVTRIDETIESELVHEGMCAGSTPVHASARRPGPPWMSANLQLVELCNLNGVPVIVTLSETTSGVSGERMLGLRECFNPTEPGMIGGLETARTVSVRALVPDLGARCSATGPNSPPAPLRTLARAACR